MKIHFVILLLILNETAVGQNKTVPAKYQDCFGHALVLNSDSTFRFDWRFDLIHDWASGRWTVSGREITLNFINVYDTLSRPGMQDSLVFSIDEESDRVNQEEFLQTQIVSGGQHTDRFDEKFYQRGKRLFPADQNGRPIKNRQRGIWPQKKWYGYKTWPTFYKKES
jgi:hypothetical protein